jgi:ATP-binding cassette subfamily B protein
MAKLKNKKDKKKISFRYNLSVYWSLLRKYKKLLFSLLFVIFLVETLFVADKFLFKIIIDDGTEFLAGNIAHEIFLQTLIIIAIVFALVVFTRTILKWMYIHLMNNLDGNTMHDIKQRFFNHIVGLHHGFHTTHKTGSLISRLGRGSSAMESMTDTITSDFAPLFFQLVVVGFSLLLFDKISALILLLTAIAFISYSFLLQQVQQESKLKYIRSQDVEKANVGDVFMNIDSIKYFGKEKHIGDRFAKLTKNTREDALKYWGFYRWFDAGQVLILGVGTFFLLYFPLIGFLDKTISLGTLVFIYAIYGNIVGPMFSFVWGMRSFYRSMADFEDLFMYEKFENEIKDKPDAEDLKIENGEIEFKDVTFGYHKRNVIDNVNLHIKPGEKVAFVGHSGSGKTTLVKLLYRFYDVNSGGIYIDGKNIKNVNQESLRSELSIVPQEAILFDDTIYNNIAFSNLKAKRAEVLAAMKFAQLDKLVENLPKKERTIVGERGVKLSGGEKQRVSIARALLADKKVLVLDEATSALDSKTEYEIQKDLKKLMEGRTSIIIAHRLSTIMGADKIVVTDNGKIVQIGKHNDLIKKQGVYRELWDLQKGGYIEE